MGDRCNIVVCARDVEGKNLGQALEEGQAVVFYGHWAGSDMPVRLHAGLVRGKGRWDDDAYLGRIIFCNFCQSVADLSETTGYGIIAGGLGDNERPILLVDVPRQKVVRYGTGYVSPNTAGALEPAQEWSFEEFIELDEGDLERIVG